MEHRIPIGISLSEEMVDTIDTRRGDIPRSRYIQRALEHICRKDQCTNNEKRVVHLIADRKPSIK
jgi:metal-responsive CopG/Arc/MetJ family transcriptional regulator